MISALATAPQPGSIGSPLLWAATIGVVVTLLAVDFLVTRRPHAVGMREAVLWSAVYLAVPLIFGGYLWGRFGTELGTEYLTGYVVEKSLSVDNLFVFMLLLSAFAVPAALAQRVLLYGVIGALAMRAVFIVLGTAVLARFTWAYLIFGGVLLLAAVKALRDGVRPEHQVAVGRLRSVRLIRRLMPVTGDYRGTRMLVHEGGRRQLTPMAVVVFAVLAADMVFAVDSIPAVYGITGDPFLVFATNAYALLGLRALYFVLRGAVGRLVHLSYGLAAILAFIAVKLVAHWAHQVWPAVPEIPTLASLGVILAILAVVTGTSLLATRSGRPTVADPTAAPPASRADAGPRTLG